MARQESWNLNIFKIQNLMDEWTIKTSNPTCRLFLKIDLTEFAALCLTDFIDWRYIHSLVGIFDPACKLLPPWTKELYLCTVGPLSSLWPPPPLPKLIVQYLQTVCGWEGGGMLNCAVDHILQVYTLFLTRFRTYEIASLPQTKMTSKDDIKGWVSLKFLSPCRT